MPTPSRKRILIVSVNWLGDLLFMTPAIRAIRRAHPASYIACLVPERGLDLLATNPHLDAVIPMKESRGFAGLARWWPLIRFLKTDRFDTVYLFHRSFTRALVMWLAGIPSRVGYRTWKRAWLLTRAADPPPKDSVHKSVWFLRMLEADGIPSDGLRYDVKLLPQDHEKAGKLLEEFGVAPLDRLVAVHPGGNWKLKRWPAAHFAQLGDALATEYRTKVLFIGDAAERPVVEGILHRMRTKPLVATGRTTFRQLGALLARAQLFISNDSGPLHLGVAVGTPVIALFGPTDPRLTGPPNGTQQITLFGSIGCPIPCYRLTCPVNLCMQQITVEQVLEAAGKFLFHEDPRH